MSAPGPAPSSTFRRQVYARLRAALGPPEVARVRAGELYRWTLERPRDLTLYVTMDSPEREDFAHVMLSDDERYQGKPLLSFMVYTLDEADRLIGRILKQWKDPRTARE